MMLKDFFNFVYINFAAQFQFHRGYRLIVYPAGHNIFKVIQVGIYVKGQPVHGNPAAAAYTQGADLAGTLVIGIKPNAGIAGVAACFKP
jgi:hypothetical protein